MAYAFLNQAYIDGGNHEFVKLIERTLTEIVIPEGVKKIGKSAFGSAASLKKITIPEGVEIIEDTAFSWSGLSEVILPLSCHTLTNNALYGSSYMERIQLGNVKSIGKGAFNMQYKCKEYDFTRCDSIPTLADNNVFDSVSLSSNPTILVPAALYDEWIVATNWATYADYIVPAAFLPVIKIPEKASEGLLIENGVLKGRGSCTDNIIVVPEEVTGTEWQLFNNDNQIDTLILPEKGIRIDGYLGENSTLRVLMNYCDMNTSFGLSTAANLEFISIIGSCDIYNYQFFGLPDGIKYDFSRCEFVPVLGSTEYITVSEGTLIYVPLELYDEWINATNWSEISEYIAVAR